MDFAIPAKDRLKHQLGLTVGIDRTLRQRLVDRHALGNAEGGASRGEDEFFDTEFHGHVEKVDARGHIVAKILRWIFHRLANKSIGSKMHHSVRLGFAKGMAQNGTVSEVALVKIRPGIHRFGMPLGEVVKNRDFESPVDEFFHADAADVTSAARYEYFFHFRFLGLNIFHSSDNQIPRPLNAENGGRSRCFEGWQN